MGWLYFLAGLFVGNLAAFVAIALAQSMRKSEEIISGLREIPLPFSDTTI